MYSSNLKKENATQRPAPQYDAVNTGAVAAFLGFTPFFGMAIGFYLLHRGADDLLFSVDMLERYRWLAVLPFERAIIGNAGPFVLQFLLASNILAAAMLVVGIPFALAPKPIIAKRLEGQWRSLAIGNLMFIALFYAIRVFLIYKMAHITLVQGKDTIPFWCLLVFTSGIVAAFLSFLTTTSWIIRERNTVDC